MKTKGMIFGLLASAGLLAMHTGAWAQEDAAAFIEQVTAPSAPWSGPTSGPQAQEGKSVIYISTDQRNGGAKGVGEGAEAAAKVLGWEFRTMDGQGSISARSTAMSQAIALQPDGIILGGIDATEQAPLIEQATEAGIKVVGWHAGAAPGRSRSRRCSPTSPPIPLRSRRPPASSPSPMAAARRAW